MRLHRDLWFGDDHIGILTLTTTSVEAHAMLDQQKMEELMSIMVSFLHERLPEAVTHAHSCD